MKSLKIKLAVSIFQLYSNNYRDYLLLIKQKEKQELLELNKESLIKPKMNVKRDTSVDSTFNTSSNNINNNIKDAFSNF